MEKKRRHWPSILLGLVLAAFLWPAWASPQDGWVSNSTFFDVDTHGWPFENDTYEFYLFAKDTFVEISPEWSVCGGMSLSAKKRFLADIPVEDFAESVKQELIDNQWETVGGKVPEKGATFLWWMSRPDYPHTFDKHTIGAATKEEWPTIKTSIDMGFPLVLGLVLVGPTWHGLPIALWDVGENHQVLAIGYSSNDRTMERKILVYDSNHPRKVVTISMNFGLPDNQIDAKYSEPLSDGKKVRGFFVINGWPLCVPCDCIRRFLGQCVSWLREPSSVPLGYRYLGDSLSKLQPKPPAAFSVPINYPVH